MSLNRKIVARTLLFFVCLYALDLIMPADFRSASLISVFAVSLMIGSIPARRDFIPVFRTPAMWEQLIPVIAAVVIWIGVSVVDLTGPKRTGSTFASGVACMVGAYGIDALRSAWRAWKARQSRRP
jgi:hypothetical protein